MVLFTKQIAGLLLIGTALFTACKSSETTATPTDRVTVRLNQSARLSSDVLVQVDTIQDSRCPSNVQCIWAGQANVSLQLSKGGDTRKIRLTLGPDMQEGYAKRLDSATIMLNNQSYQVILREVNPYPNTATVGEQQTAVIQVTKL